MASNSARINDMVRKAESKAAEAAKKFADHADGKQMEEKKKVVEKAERDLQARLAAEAKAIDKALADFKTREAAAKLVDSSLDKILDDAVKKFIAANNKSDTDFNQRLKDLIRSHKTVFFNEGKRIDQAAVDAKKQLDAMIDQKAKSMLDEKLLTQQLRPLDALVNKTQAELNSELLASTKLSIVKELDKNLASMLKDPIKDLDLTPYQGGLNNLTKELNAQVTSIQSALAVSLTENMAADIAEREAQVAEVTKKIVEVEKQVKQYEKQLQDKTKDLQSAVNAKMKEAETKLIDDISKSIKLNF